MKTRRLIAACCIAAMTVGVSASGASAKRNDGSQGKKCPPGQTAVVTVVGTELVTTCRVL